MNSPTTHSLAGRFRVVIDDRVFAMLDGMLLIASVHLDGYVPHFVRDRHEWSEVDKYDHDADVAIAALIAAYLEDASPPNHEG